MKEKLSLVLLVFLIACRSDSGSSPVIAESLVGTWQVIEATRNNRPALSLENSEFYISDSLFSTNFLPDTAAHAYSYDGKAIILADPQESRFFVSRDSRDTLIFNTEIRNFDFEFKAVKKTDTDDD